MTKPNFLRYPHIQVKTIFRYVRVWIPHLFSLEPRKILVPLLKATIRQSVRFVDPVPGIDGQGPSESQRPNLKGLIYVQVELFFSRVQIRELFRQLLPEA